MARRRLFLAMLAALGFALGASGCDGEKTTFSVLSGSENRSLEPIIQEFCRTKRVECGFTYLGSVEIRQALDTETINYDAVWPAQARWIELGDTRRRVKHVRSIMQSPVVFGVRRDVAERLGLTARKPTTADLLELVRGGKLRFIMTSATQSNSGFSAYIAMLTALAGSPEVLTDDALDKPALLEKVREMLRGQARTAGSSAWLMDLYLEGAATNAYEAMINYESVLIETNLELQKRGHTPLHMIYPADGVAVADSPLGFVPRGSEAREKFFLELQTHLLSEKIQARLLAEGRRTGLGGTMTGADPAVFRRDWGIDVAAILPAIRFPAAKTIDRALMLYQDALRRPSLLALCLDFSGSMKGDGEKQLKAAIFGLFDPDEARRHMLQATRRDVFIILPFNHRTLDLYAATGPAEAQGLISRVQALSADGGTNIYACAQRAIEEVRRRPEFDSHLAAVMLMTDGRSEGDEAAFMGFYRERGGDVPIYSITFGDADPQQLDRLAKATRARVFDGRKNLNRAFRDARGYN